jgi:hypothetical protein
MISVQTKTELNRAVGVGLALALFISLPVLINYTWPHFVSAILATLAIAGWFFGAPGEIAAQYGILILFNRPHGGPPLIYFSIMTIFNFLFYGFAWFAFLRLTRKSKKIVI